MCRKGTRRTPTRFPPWPGRSQAPQPCLPSHASLVTRAASDLLRPEQENGFYFLPGRGRCWLPGRGVRDQRRGRRLPPHTAAGGTQPPGQNRQDREDGQQTHLAEGVAGGQVRDYGPGVGEEGAGVGPFLEQRATWEEQGERSQHLPGSQQYQEERRIAQACDKVGDEGQASDVPNTSQAHFAAHRRGG